MMSDRRRIVMTVDEIDDVRSASADCGPQPPRVTSPFLPSASSSASSQAQEHGGDTQRSSLRVSPFELVMMHRRSLAGLSCTSDPNEGIPDAAIEELSGVTLSRRHTQTQEEYERRRDEAAYRELESFQCPFDAPAE